MNIITKTLLYLSDRELFKKPESPFLRQFVISDILRVDPAKWYHPKLPNGETTPYWGTIETVDGKQVFKNGDLDLYTYKHPDLKYDLKHYPLGTYPDGYGDKLTQKDMGLIADAFYSRKDKRTDRFSTNARILTFRYRQFTEIFLFITGLIGGIYLLFLWQPKIVIVALILTAICFVGGYALGELIKLIKS